MARKNNVPPPADTKSPGVALEKSEKGRFMWELLMQLRVLLPYLGRLLPLLDGGTPKPSIDLRAFEQSVRELHTGNRDLEVQARNQALQMERIEAQMAQLRLAQQSAAQESGKVYQEIRTLRRLLLGMGILTIVLLLLTAGLVSILLIHP